MELSTPGSVICVASSITTSIHVNALTTCVERACVLLVTIHMISLALLPLKPLFAVL